ncbi:YhdP family protein [Rheinheimera sp. MMS21-TC3]|uniref:YhdP family protein n=1 Tax=Rheinheimera sp. MMS21-TC3 TaxID=3072790 RepID=UPI0028C496D3|nr:YhdP family protein [Rheinheimera sp. MMS21-TC3]WNO59914.1 YhdP family protein [Rheinheimera sp. MMS21-TC3]
MPKVKRFCFFCLHKLWLALAISVVVLAVVISVLRYSLPYADNYKLQLEQFIAEKYAVEVNIGELSAGWQKFGPALLVKNLRLASQGQTQIYIAETRVRLDFWRSLRNLTLTAQHFELSGLKYYVDADSLFSVESSTNLPEAPILTALEQLFFQQLTYFSIVDSQLIVQDDNSADVVVNVSQLDWTNHDKRHQGNGELSVAGVTNNSVSFILDLYGNSWAEAYGQLYLQSDKLDVLPWFRSWLPTSQKLDYAKINMQAWGVVKKGTLQLLQIELAENSLSWQRDGPQFLQLGAGQLLWQPINDGWELTSGYLTLSDQEQTWPEISFAIQRQGDNWQGNINQFQLDAITPLANLFAEDSQLLRQLVKYQPSGYLNQFNWQRLAGEWQGAGSFSQLASSAVQDIPGVSDVQGSFVFDGELAKITLQSTDSRLEWDGLFSEATDYIILDATAYLRYRPQQQWQLIMPQIALQNGDLQLDAAIQYDGKLKMLAKLQHLDAVKAKRYFPNRYMPEAVADYLTDAIKAGQLEQATMLWHGATAEFPFQQRQGVFQVKAELKQGEFAFQPDWPELTDLAVELWFENAAMVISSQSGNLMDIKAGKGVTASIADLFHADHLDIHIQRQAEAKTVTALMQQSPLADSLGATLAYLGASGVVNGDVTLQVALDHNEVQAKGNITFNQASIALQAPEMAVQQLKGTLSFENDKIRGQNVQLNWRGLPIQADINGKNTNVGYQLALKLSAEQEAKQLALALYPSAEPLVSGTNAWQLRLALNLADTGFNYHAQLNSNLANTELNLPAPYNKTADEQRKLSITVHGNEHENDAKLAINYANMLYFHADIDRLQHNLNRAHLVLGSQDEAIPSDDFTISVNLAQADFLSWYELIQPQLVVETNEQPALFPHLSYIRGRIGQLQLPADIRLNNAVFDLNQLADLWQLQLNATEVASRWQFHKNWQQQGITAELDYLMLPWPLRPKAESNTRIASVKASKSNELDPQLWLVELPPITINCADCSVGAYRFGKVSAQAHSTADSWQLDRFNARYKKHELNLTGAWQRDANNGLSNFSGGLTSPNFGSLLDEFQLTSAISGSDANVNFNLSWAAAPNQFDLSKLNGEVDYKLGEGSLTEVSDKGARLFSIFSLDSLVRKLRLDFRDVFSKGFFYNKMTGNLTLTKGVAQTSDAAIDGVPGNLAIQGYADLVGNKLDYQMSFAPKVTSSLPIIIAWMVNPATGLAALALDEVFQSAEVISKINFTITGSIDEPIVTEVNRHSTEIPVPVRIAKPDPAIEPDPTVNKLPQQPEQLQEQQPNG